MVAGLDRRWMSGSRRREETGANVIDERPAPVAVAVAGLSRTVLDSAMDAVIMIDANGRVIFWNRAATAMFGRTEDETLGQELAKLIIPPELRRRHRDALSRSGLRGASSILGRRLDVAGQRRDGSCFPVELTIAAAEVGDADGGQLFIGYLRDISERKKLLSELRQSRARLVEVSDQTRRRIERDLHDGAQQQLVGAAMAVSAARASLGVDLTATEAMLTQASQVLFEAISEIRELARGVLPSSLADHGLRPALAELARRSPIPVQVEAVGGRWPSTVETSFYFLAAEALTNAAKHGASNARIELSARPMPAPALDRQSTSGSAVLLSCSVIDDGPGGADVGRGSGLLGLADRLAAVGGHMIVDSPPGAGTRIEGRVTVPAHPTDRDRAPKRSSDRPA